MLDNLQDLQNYSKGVLEFLKGLIMLNNNEYKISCMRTPESLIKLFKVDKDLSLGQEINYAVTVVVSGESAEILKAGVSEVLKLCKIYNGKIDSNLKLEGEFHLKDETNGKFATLVALAF
jgi:hypothetical protein